MSWNEMWANAALCKKSAPDELFVRGAEQHKAKAVCGACPVRAECLAEALDNEIEWGVWGGLTERERRALLRKRPERHLVAPAAGDREVRARAAHGARASSSLPDPDRPSRVASLAGVHLGGEQLTDPA